MLAGTGVRPVDRTGEDIILFSLPMIAGNLLQQVYSLVDTMIVGNYISSQALAAVGSSYTLMGLFFYKGEIWEKGKSNHYL